MNELWRTTKLSLIPEITDEEIAEMRHIELLVGNDFPFDQRLQRVQGFSEIDPKNVSCIWDAVPVGPKMMFGPLNSLKIITFHEYGAPALLKPSLAEVYASIRRFVPDWKGVRYFHLRSKGLGAEHIIGEYHWCFCDLFGEVDWEEEE